MRRISKNPYRKLLFRADACLQNWFRAKYPKAKCEVCGRKAEVRHHHLEKSKSNAGRYNHDNLIALCYSCHSKIIFGDHNVVAIYSIKRGKDWVDRMEDLRKIKKSYFSQTELKNIILLYEIVV